MSLQQQKEEHEQLLRSTRESKAWYQFLEKHREVMPCEANFNQTVRYFNGSEITLPDLEDSYQNPAFRNSLALRHESDERLALCTEILAHYPSDGAKRQIAMHFKHKPTEELRRDLSTLQSRREVSQLPVAELRKLANPKPVDDGFIPPDYDRRKILGMTADELTRFLRKYDSPSQKDEIVRRLNDRSNG